MRFLKAIGFLVLALLVCAAFVYPFFAVPERYEDKAREITMGRIEESGAEVGESYIAQSIREAVELNIPVTVRTSFLLAVCAALIVYLLSIRPPHDCGGINWFNPLALIFVIPIALLTGLVIIKGSEIIPAENYADFTAAVASLRDIASGAWKGLPYILLAAAALEVVFRGIVFSYLERIHATVAIIISPVLYAFVIAVVFKCYSDLVQGWYKAYLGAIPVALFIGAVMGLITWRLRSGIPAVLAHVLIAYEADALTEYASGSAAPIGTLLAIMGALLLVFLLLPALSSRVRVFAYDFPFSEHHMRLREWLYGRRRLKGEKAASAEERSASELTARAAAAAGHRPSKEAEQPKRSKQPAPKKSAPASGSKPAEKKTAPVQKSAPAKKERKRRERVKGAPETAANIPAKGGK
ncbi:MAG: CPBP family intramembrane metalloprotease [Clostridia bacterium]|nr:CPBP family intramembrane metalloprotease [Clostridia bacterium]